MCVCVGEGVDAGGRCGGKLVVEGDSSFLICF